MSWVKLDDGFPDHPKQLAAGAVACWLWACGLAYCNRQKKRDGFIPAVKVPLLYPFKNVSRLASRLVEVGLWDEVDGGFVVHDYLDYQLPAELSEATREVRKAAGRIGGIRSGEVRRERSNLLQAKEADASSDVLPSPKHFAEVVPNPYPSRPDPVLEESHSPAPARDPSASAPVHGVLTRFASLYYDVVDAPHGDNGSLRLLWLAVSGDATHRQAEPWTHAEALLNAYRAMLKSWRSRGYHGKASALHMLNEFPRVLDWFRGEKPGPKEKPAANGHSTDIGARVVPGIEESERQSAELRAAKERATPPTADFKALVASVAKKLTPEGA